MHSSRFSSGRGEGGGRRVYAPRDSPVVVGQLYTPRDSLGEAGGEILLGEGRV